MTNNILNYFLVSVFVVCGYGLYFWILFQFCGLILYFFVCCRFVMLISVLGFLFLFSGSVFLFWVSHFVVCVSVLGLFSLLFLLLLLLFCGFFVSIGHPIYLIVLCI